MSVLEEALRGNRVVIEVPRSGVADWVAAAEVLLFEGLRAWALPPEQLALLPEVLALYGHRARVGVCGVSDADGVRSAAEAGAHFILSPVSDAALGEAAGGVPLLGGALTPSEVAAAVRAGAEAVLVAPADALGTAYARTLPPMFPGTALVPWGRLERYQCEMWLDAGATACVVSDVVLRPEGEGTPNTPEEVARRAGAYRSVLGN